MSLNMKRVVIFVLGLALCVALLMVADQERRRHLAPEQMTLAQLGALVKDDSRACIQCHNEKTPGVVDQWAKSQHAVLGVGCLDCHGASADAPAAWNHEGTLIQSILSPKACATCHPKESVEFAASHHNTAGMILHSADNMLGEFVAGGPNAVLGCKQCHGGQVSFVKTFEDGSTFELDMVDVSRQVMQQIMRDHQTDLKGLLLHKATLQDGMAEVIQAKWSPFQGKAPKLNTPLRMDHEGWPNSGIGRFNPNGSLGSCNACHSRHEFSKALARQPENCGKCHMGPDHPQFEIYNESKHGIAFRNRLSEMNLDDLEWVVGHDYSAAPTCATCHMSSYRTAEGVQPVTHDVGLRISWTLRPEISTLTTSHSATINLAGEPESFELAWDAKRNRMKGVCTACHSTTHIESFYTQYDALVNLYNEKFARPGMKLMAHVNAKGYLDEPDKKGFAHELTWIWFELWHHEGRRMRHGASMMGPDYTHWHGSYEVAKHFYVKFLPKLESLAKEHNDAALAQLISEVLAMPENAWYDGMDAEEAARLRTIYSQ
ncbi:MAG: hypothetical protein JXA69_21280, partial [Phycisphaerae bacterium]|nr:hypothetical protein [Phycisphaerae bacterium]